MRETMEEKKMTTAEAVAQRQELMKSQAALMRTIQEKIKAGQVQAIAPDAEALAKSATKINALFPPGSLDPNTSRAKPDIWQKFPEFEGYSRALEANQAGRHRGTDSALRHHRRRRARRRRAGLPQRSAGPSSRSEPRPEPHDRRRGDDPVVQHSGRWGTDVGSLRFPAVAAADIMNFQLHKNYSRPPSPATRWGDVRGPPGRRCRRT
jgi:hypothetical protein